MPTKERLTEDHPRWSVRYVYLADEWPEAASYPSPAEAILAAPADACLRALARDVRTYGDLLRAEREEAKAVRAELTQLHDALRLLGQAMGVQADG